ncbi:MAG: hypothetical protein NTZ50_04425 [Chloroflexi bacterium]|nr:hypothetical protein [Chloroflexota bacterium]
MAEDIQFYNNTDEGAPQMPKRPPSDARIERYRVMPWPDGTRVTVEMTFGAFKEFPSIDVSIVNTAGDVVRQTAMVSSMERQPAPTMWLPRLDRGTPLLALIEVLGDEAPLQSIHVPFEVAGPIVRAVLTDG